MLMHGIDDALTAWFGRIFPLSRGPRAYVRQVAVVGGLSAAARGDAR